MATKRKQRSSKPRRDVYQDITDTIVRQLEDGIRPWLKPWNAEHAAGRITRPLRHNGEPYNGMNILMLWCSAEEHGFVSPYWLTFKQAQALGGHVRKGEKGSPVVYASTFEKTDTNANGEDVEQRIPFLKQYTVFAADQCEGLSEHFYELKQPPNESIERIAAADTFFQATEADIREGGNRAYYAIGSDHIQMPPLECFRDAESQAATLAHELTHWTRHKTRLDRDLGRKRWGDEGYAMEELVAELGSAFLWADLSITPEVMPDHAAYLASWLKVLKEDKRAIFSAASLASKAVDYLHSLQIDGQPVHENQVATV
ncbi:MAG: ArdC family protein [Planctomycetaceae bacterium]